MRARDDRVLRTVDRRMRRGHRRWEDHAEQEPFGGRVQPSVPTEPDRAAPR